MTRPSELIMSTNNHALYKQDKAAIQKSMWQHALKWRELDSSVMPTKTVYSDEAHQLDSQLIIAAVVLMVAFLGLSGGSVGDIDLYKVNLGYLQDPDLRGRMNSVVREREAEVRRTEAHMLLG